MKSKQLRERDDLIGSLIFNRGIYTVEVEDWHFHTHGGEEIGGSEILRNTLTGERFYYQNDNTCHTLSYYENLIRHPARRENIVWPCDLVHRTNDMQGELDVSNLYGDRNTQQNRAGSYCILFPETILLKTSCKAIFEGIQDRTWKNKEILQLAHKILAAFGRLNEDGYLYLDVHLSRFLIDETGKGEIMLEYSNLIFPNTSEGYSYTPGSGEIPPECMHPDLALGKSNKWTLWEQNFCLTALLFYLFIGRYPYDGRLMEGYPDDTMQNHYIKFRDYHKMPIFIFDETDDSNGLGLFSNEQKIIERWQALPQEIREIFTAVLCVRDQKTHKIAAETMTPRCWLAILNKHQL